jgi:L-lactate dehydrogenase complex protein LldG
VERDAFLARTRLAAARAVLPDVQEAGFVVPELAVVDDLEAFATILATAGGELHDADPLSVLAGLVGRYGIESFMMWDDLPVPGLEEGLRALGLRHIDANVPTGGRIEHQLGYLDVVLGVTGAEAAFVESGSIVVRSGVGRPRMASLVPLVHVALLPRNAVFRSLSHWAAEHAGTMAAAANVVFITGVSRTGDIEMRLNTGVHGPGHLHVIMV